MNASARVPITALSGAGSGGGRIVTGSLPYPAAGLVCSSLVLAAGGAALAGLAPADRDVMLQVSLGRMEFIFQPQLVFLGAVVLPHEWEWKSSPSLAAF